MSYELHFHPTALKEWKKLDRSVSEQFKKVLLRRLENPHQEKSKLRGKLNGLYKIKLRQSGYRLVYQVQDKTLIVLVLGVGKRDKEMIYKLVSGRGAE
ncbi:MAG: type II toxin-antitoxin system mRNA interferase toxin, RelE/StbE family [Legionellales bacterium]|nr:type II toxin-antitoxin system mRNA interferase toxin, RelE/StbE family [Legionellales bacterium]|tara:strand:- start:45547 stop:45840 length:294 start_codon:yes stop_codon:yes gene_type:complete